MRSLFSTDNMPTKDRYRRWTEYCDEYFLPLNRTRIGEDAFSANLRGTQIGGLYITRTSYGPSKIEANKSSISHERNRSSSLYFNIKLAGQTIITQDGRTVIQKAGDASIYDTIRPFAIIHPGPVDQVSVEVPRGRLESVLGSAQNFTGLTMHRHLPVAGLTRSFFAELIRFQENLDGTSAARMAMVGIDLVVASIAERMALETPEPLRGTVNLQRAKTYIEANLSDPYLAPAQVAAALNVSLRYLQERFRENGRRISDWIWHRRLETAAQRLADPGLMHLSIGSLAYSCGFSSQAHFSRRFKQRYEMIPRDFRHTAQAHASRATTSGNPSMKDDQRSR